MCCRAPYFATLTILQWCSVIGWTLWTWYNNELAYFGIMLSPWLLLALMILMGAHRYAKPLTLTQGADLIAKLQLAPSPPIMEGNAYHYIDIVDNNINGVENLATTICPSRYERRVCDMTITTMLNVHTLTTNKLFTILTVDRSWLYADNTSKSNSEQQVDAFRTELERYDRHVDINMQYNADLTSQSQHFVAIKAYKPTFCTLALYALLGISWFYVEWLLRHSDHQHINVVHYLAYAPVHAKNEDVKTTAAYPCACVKCRTIPV